MNISSWWRTFYSSLVPSVTDLWPRKPACLHFLVCDNGELMMLQHFLLHSKLSDEEMVAGLHKYFLCYRAHPGEFSILGHFPYFRGSINGIRLISIDMDVLLLSQICFSRPVDFTQLVMLIQWASAFQRWAWVPRGINCQHVNLTLVWHEGASRVNAVTLVLWLHTVMTKLHNFQVFPFISCSKLKAVMLQS